jgi:uncharacterized protein (DUF1684 family)
MSGPEDPIALADWRRRVAEIYAAVRMNPDPQAACASFRQERDRLFHMHPQSPFSDEQRSQFTSLPYFTYDPIWRVMARIERNVASETLLIRLPDEGEVTLVRFARVFFSLKGRDLSLSLFWIAGYGGGLFLPFRDTTNHKSTYGGGRYLYDTVKGADLNSDAQAFLLDFNFAYNPSCAYNDRWVCPLSPPENQLKLPIMAGEQYPC